MRSTSVEAWEHLQDTGALGHLQLLVLTAVLELEPCTAREAEQRPCLAGLDGAWKRLSELERQGLVEAAGERKCTVTGRKATTWQLTGRREPRAAEPRETRPTPGQVRRAARILATERRYQALERGRAHGQGELELMPMKLSQQEAALVDMRTQDLGAWRDTAKPERAPDSERPPLDVGGGCA